MKLLRVIVFTTLFCFFSLNSEAKFRIGLFQKELPKEIIVSGNVNYCVLDPGSKKVIYRKNKNEELKFIMDRNKVIIKDSSNIQSDAYDKLLLHLEDEQNGYFEITTKNIKKRKYKESLEVQSTGDFILAINNINEEDYVYSILINEMPSNWHKQALKAQAVVIRSFIRDNLKRHSDRNYDFCDLTHCQVYKGLQAGYLSAKSAVEETKNEVIVYKGKIIKAFYHSTCGGVSANNEDIWIGKEPIDYLRSVPDKNKGDDFCAKSPHYYWKFEIKRPKLEEVFAKSIKNVKHYGKFIDVTISKKSLDKRIKKIIIRYSDREIEISGYEFYLMLGRNLGWHLLKSTKFEIDKRNNNYLFKGMGLGHGIGMCQWGARAMAEMGFDYKKILMHYFPNTEIKILNP